MPKTKKGKRIMAGFKKRYGKKAGERIAYATANKRGGGLKRALHGGKKRR
jgi:hypothetical protein